MGLTPVKPFYHALSTKDGGRARAYQSVSLLRLARPLLFGQKFIVQVSHPHLLCALLIREHAVGFFVITHVIVVRT